ncbi:hypothetical protein [Undibacterium sp.]|uniref:hypothetical protein n=1 Tax=Undibacterium sp. TaxID=1914977 RepID=UPI003752B51E
MHAVDIGDLVFRHDEVTLKVHHGDFVLAQLPLASVLEFARRFDHASKEAEDANGFKLIVAPAFPYQGVSSWQPQQTLTWD